jgi:hypothetical protein
VGGWVQTLNRATALFAVAIAVALVVSYGLRDTTGSGGQSADGSATGDIAHYVTWTRLVTLGGIQAAYAGTWPETYAVYPPVTLYPYQVIGTLYRALEDPAFDAQRALQSVWLRQAIKFVALCWHLLTALAIYALVGQRWGASRASVAGALYVANPAALYDVAHWAQPDGAHSLFSVLAVGLLGFGHVSSGSGSMALAVLAKPQAWAVVPLAVVALLRRRGPYAVLSGAAVSAVVGGAVVLPFAVSGHLGELLSLPRTVAQVMPVVSANAHNLWWLTAWAHQMNPLSTLDSTRAVGPLTFRMVAGALVLAQFAFSAWLYWTGRVSLAEGAAIGTLGWFVCTTQAHENHLFLALPLLALAWPARQSLLPVLALLSLTVLCNMVLHDQLVLDALGQNLRDPLVERLRLVNAGANVACFVAWGLVRAAAATQVGYEGGT